MGFSPQVLKMGIIDLHLQGHLAISTQSSKKQHSTSLLYIDLAKGCYTSQRALVLILAHNEHVAK